jgi:regulator of replication initiation timing
MASKIQVLENLQIENDHLRHSLSTTTIQLQELRLNSRSQKLRNDDVDSEAETVTL